MLISQFLQIMIESNIIFILFEYLLTLIIWKAFFPNVKKQKETKERQDIIIPNTSSLYKHV